MTKPIYVKSAEMFQEIYTSLQHHGRENLFESVKEHNILEEILCYKCGAILASEEIEQLEDCCFDCHLKIEDNHPLPPQE